mmetsp:Transcript_14190/g.16419  ORF Transcript_14190/g.16419 Transcript_14190/m.16419 type:complete len:173 (-) Transcript_14190:50-568(-)
MDNVVRTSKRSGSRVREEVAPEEFEDHMVPSNFFNDTYLLPSFYMPENKELLIATHNNIRRSMFYQAFRDVKYTEYRRLKVDDDFFEFKSLEDAQEGWLDYFNDHYLQPERNHRLLGVQKWKFNRNGLYDSEYLVKFYHTDKDEFRSKIYPLNFRDYIRLRWYNRRYFKVVV